MKRKIHIQGHKNMDESGIGKINMYVMNKNTTDRPFIFFEPECWCKKNKKKIKKKSTFIYLFT